MDNVFPGLPMTVYSDFWRMPLAEDNCKLTTQGKENEREVSQGQRPKGPRSIPVCTSFPLSSHNIFTSSKYLKGNCRIRIIHALSFLSYFYEVCYSKTHAPRISVHLILSSTCW